MSEQTESVIEDESTYEHPGPVVGYAGQPYVGPYLSREIERRAHALQFAHDPQANPKEVIDRARVYLGFLNGEQASDNG